MHICRLWQTSLTCRHSFHALFGPKKGMDMQRAGMVRNAAKERRACALLCAAVAVAGVFSSSILLGTSSDGGSTAPPEEPAGGPPLLSLYLSEEQGAVQEEEAGFAGNGVQVLQSSTLHIDPLALNIIDPRLTDVEQMPVVRMELFSDLVVDVEFLNARPRRKMGENGEPVEDGFLIRGRILPPESGYVVLRARDGGVFGSISVDGEDRIELWRNGGPLHTAKKMEFGELTCGADVDEVAEQAMNTLGLTGLTEGGGSMPTDCLGSCDDGCTIDLLVLFTAATEEHYANQSIDVRDRIELRIDEANAIFAQSEIVVDPEHDLLRIVGMGKLVYHDGNDYVEAGKDIKSVVTEFRTLESVHRFRDSVRADLVSLWVFGTSGAGGAANTPHTYSLSNETEGFSALKQHEGWVVAHEFGHNFGFQHDRFETCGCSCLHQCGGASCGSCSAVQDFAFGWHFKALRGTTIQDYRTIMTYATCLSGQLLNYFSNPGVELDETGEYMGKSLCADNALVARGDASVYGTRFLVAQHRTSHDTSGTTTRIQGIDDTPPDYAVVPLDNSSRTPAISGGGQFVLFSSDAVSAPGYTFPNTYENVFRYNRESGIATLLSFDRTAPTQGANADSGQPAIAGNGSLYVFASSATNLVSPPVTPAQQHVWMRRATGVPSIVSRISDTAHETSPPTPGAPGNGASGYPAVNHDGTQIAYESVADNLADDDENDVSDIFVTKLSIVTYDACPEEAEPCEEDAPFLETVRISVSTNGDEADGPSYRPAISATGRFVAFESEATNLGDLDTEGIVNIWIHDRDTNDNGVFDVPTFVSTTEVSRAWDFVNDGIPDGDSYAPSISADGRYTVYHSSATNLLDPSEWTIHAADPLDPPYHNIYLYDWITDETHLISRHWTNVTESAIGHNINADFSPDGKWIAFLSDSEALHKDHTTAAWRIYIYSVEDGGIARVIDAGEVNDYEPGEATRPKLSGDGRFVAFDLDASIANDPGQVFLHDRGPMLPGDLNGDGIVDQIDLDNLMLHWYQDCECCAADLDGDGFVGGDDYLILTGNWTGGDSCDGQCGGQAISGCWCHDSCCHFGDCCADKFDECGGCDPSGSCEGYCGLAAPSGCFCDEYCCESLDCCGDKLEQCGGCEPQR